ncbi:MAG: DUF3102 domain-containing protein [Selenomonadaceae bacterium]|nr:DUF3102 domain-containing protein [Selenomonadaceae bacterium]MBR6887753.1 DUF3102 domain-containing protein [Selenomonadaceae bacterium]
MNELISTHDEWKDLLITDENVTVQGYTVRAAPQLTLEIGFYLKQTAQNIIEVGKRLIVMKSFVKHGQWQQWLEKNFQLGQSAANKFMSVAERFGNSDTYPNFSSSQMVALLSLPDAEETEKFIEQKAAEGKAVADMTIKQLREEIAEYKKQFDAAQKNFQQSLFDLGEKNKAVIDEQEQNYQRQLDDLNEQLAAAEQELKVRPTIAPDDYQSTKTELAEAKKELVDTKVALALSETDKQKQAEEFAKEKEKMQADFDDSDQKKDQKIIKLTRANERLTKKYYEKPSEISHDDFKLICADIRGGLLEVEDNSVDFIITDPPYPKEYLPLYEDLSKIAARVLKNGGSLICMTGQSYLPEVMQLLTTNMTYHWCMCYLTPGQKTQLWQRHLHTAWKPLLWFVKGEHKGDWLGDDVMTSPGKDKNFHEWGQSFGGMEDIILRMTNPNDVILDPFLGGGTTGIAALSCKRKFIGSDIEQKNIDGTLARIAEVFNNGISDAGENGLAR